MAAIASSMAIIRKFQFLIEMTIMRAFWLKFFVIFPGTK